MRAGRPTGLRTFLLDITQRKRAETTLVEQADKLSRSNAELEQFAYVASHDLQEPLRKIQAFGDRLKTKYETGLGPEGLDYLTRMQNAAARMQILIQDLLSLSRVTSNSKPFAPVDLADVVRTVVSDLEMRIQDAGGRVEIGSLPVILGDRGQMAQLFQNLIGNGLKFRKARARIRWSRSKASFSRSRAARPAGGSPWKTTVSASTKSIGTESFKSSSACTGATSMKEPALASRSAARSWIGTAARSRPTAHQARAPSSLSRCHMRTPGDNQHE